MHPTPLSFTPSLRTFPESYWGVWVFWAWGAHTPYLACSKPALSFVTACCQWIGFTINTAGNWTQVWFSNRGLINNTPRNTLLETCWKDMLTPSIFHLQVLIFLLIWTQDLISIFHSKDGGSVVKTSPANAADVDPIPLSGRSLEQKTATHCSIPCLGNPMDRGTWQATVHGVAKELDTNEQLNNINSNM